MTRLELSVPHLALCLPSSRNKQHALAAASPRYLLWSRRKNALELNPLAGPAPRRIKFWNDGLLEVRVHHIG